MQDLTFFRGREAWVGDFLAALPPRRSLLRHYVWNASQVTHANAGHHVGMGLILLSQIAPMSGIRLSPGGKARSNLFALALAPTGHAKTESVNVLLGIGRRAGVEGLVTDAPGSREGLIDSLDDQSQDSSGKPRQALVYPEFSDFLGITAAARKGRQGGHAHAMRGALMSLFDGFSGTRVLARRRNTETGAMDETKRGTENPVLSLVGAANYRVLSRHTDEDDWHDGFVGRFLMIDGEMERFYPQMPLWPETMEEVISVVQQRLMWERERAITIHPTFPLPSQERPHGAFYPEAQARMIEWATKVHYAVRGELNGLVQAGLTRLGTLCERIAVLLCFDFGEASGIDTGGIPQPGWRIGLNEVEAAIYLAEKHMEAYRYASTHVVLNPEEKPIRDVEGALRRADADGKYLTEGEISKNVALNDRTVSDAIRTLLSRGVVKKVQPAEGRTTLRYGITEGFMATVLPFPGTDMQALAPSVLSAPRLVLPS